jgi:molybdate transport system substrate-binding protein
VRSSRAIALAGVLLLAASSGSAAELKIIVTGSMAAALTEIAEAFARNNGHTVAVTVGITTTVTATLKAGESSDVIEVTSVGMTQLERENLIVPGSRVEIARAMIGVAVRDGAAVPDISTHEAIRRALLQARSISYVNPRFAGQVGENLMTFLIGLGVLEAVQSKAVLAFTGEEAIRKVAQGEAEMVLAFVSEILPIHGVRWLGPVPTGLQVPTSYSAALGANSAHPELARSLLDEIRTANGQRIIRERGLEPVLDR